MNTIKTFKCHNLLQTLLLIGEICFPLTQSIKDQNQDDISELERTLWDAPKGEFFATNFDGNEPETMSNSNYMELDIKTKTLTIGLQHNTFTVLQKTDEKEVNPYEITWESESRTIHGIMLAASLHEEEVDTRSFEWAKAKAIAETIFTANLFYEQGRRKGRFRRGGHRRRLSDAERIARGE